MKKITVRAVCSTRNSCLFSQHLDFIEKLSICFTTAFQYLEHVFSTDLQLSKAPVQITSPLKFPGWQAQSAPWHCLPSAGLREPAESQTEEMKTLQPSCSSRKVELKPLHPLSLQQCGNEQSQNKKCAAFLSYSSHNLCSSHYINNVLWLIINIFSL